MISVIFRTSLINKINTDNIQRIKSILIKNYTLYSDDKNTKLILEACLAMITYKCFYNNDENGKKELHEFIIRFEFSSCLLCSLISSIKYLKYFNDITEPTTENNHINNPLISFYDLNISNLNKVQIIIIKGIFEEIIFLLIEQTKNLNDNSLENTTQQNIINSKKEIYSTIIKNIEILLNYPYSEIFKEIFSSDNEIIGELFYYKFIFSLFLEDKKQIDIIKETIINYHKILLFNHSHPFIFKFLILINQREEIKTTIDKDINNKDINKITIELLCWISEILKSYEFDPKLKNQQDIFILCNVLNLLIILHKIIIDNGNIELFKEDNFFSMFYEYIIFLDNISLLYSNYCLEFGKNCGKIVCEIIFDLFISLINFINNEEIPQKFINFFTKNNGINQEIYSVFYLMDLMREENIDKEKGIKKELEKYISLTSIEYIHKNLFNFINDDKNNIKMISWKKIQKINNVNFSIYFFAKCFLYITQDNFSQDIKNFLFYKFIPFVQQNIYRLFTKRKFFYGTSHCKEFPLYYETKKYIEQFLIQEPDNIFNSLKFFQNINKKISKNQIDISYCYSSLLIKKDKSKSGNNIKFESSNTKLDSSQILKNVFFDEPIFPTNNNDLLSIPSTKTFNKKKNNYKDFNENLIISEKNYSQFKLNIFNDTVVIDNKSLSLDEENSFNSIIDNENVYFCSFEILVKENIIINAKNLFFKKIFSQPFKNLIFDDEIFKYIRSCYLVNYKNYKGLDYQTKQLKYPTKQKNFSNGLEPKIFLKKDFNFYDTQFFKISHSYIELKNHIKFHFYPHKFNTIQEIQMKFKYKFNCELITNQYLYSGSLLLSNCFMIFLTENNKEINYDISNLEDYIFSMRCKDNENLKKLKTVIIFYDEIKEIIKRRTLLMHQSIEIFLKNGKSFFFNLFKISNANKVYKFLAEINNKMMEKGNFKINSELNEKEIKQILNLFKEGKIKTYEYLLYLNKYSSRTFNDLSQYPIFPWLVIGNIDNLLKSGLLDLNQTNNLTKNTIEKNFPEIRNFNYPISMQSEERRIAFKSQSMETSNIFMFSLGNHYSTSAYIYFYLMRINPFGNCLIRLQNYKLENPNRMFTAFDELYFSLNDGSNNRESIPEFFCDINFYCNLNCCFYGLKIFSNPLLIIDDIYEEKENYNEKNIEKNGIFDIFNNDNNINLISKFVDYLYKMKKVLNSDYIAKKINKWVDIIFGKKQLPEKLNDMAESCNIYFKFSYEQKCKLNKKLEKYINQYKNKKITLENLKKKIQMKIDQIIGYGCTSCQILTETNTYEKHNEPYESLFKTIKMDNDIFLFVTKISKKFFLLLKDDKKSNNTNHKIIIYKNNSPKLVEKYNFDCGLFNLMEEQANNIKIFLYNQKYAISHLLLSLTIKKQVSESKSMLFVLTCRFLGNYFKVQNSDIKINVICEDFVTCIVAKNSKENDTIFYTGLLNGKLIEWELIIDLDSSIEKKNQVEIKYLFSVEEKKHVYSHQSAITAIELYHKQNVIISAGVDKFVYIRKIYDFELLSVINLTYCFGNSIISKNINIFPSLIKVSDLNCLYVLLYDFDTKEHIIRGYTINGLFFAQNNSKKFIINQNDNEFLYVNNISFTKNSNILIGFYNSNKISLLSASELKPIWSEDLKYNGENDNKNKGTEWVEYSDSTREFVVLYRNEFQIFTLKNVKDQIFLDSN